MATLTMKRFYIYFTSIFSNYKKKVSSNYQLIFHSFLIDNKWCNLIGGQVVIRFAIYVSNGSFLCCCLKVVHMYETLWSLYSKKLSQCFFTYDDKRALPWQVASLNTSRVQALYLPCYCFFIVVNRVLVESI